MPIREPLGIPNHPEAVQFFNRLIIDLKLQSLGQEHDPITAERLDEASKHIRDISACETHNIRFRATALYNPLCRG